MASCIFPPPCSPPTSPPTNPPTNPPTSPVEYQTTGRRKKRGGKHNKKIKIKETGRRKEQKAQRGKQSANRKAKGGPCKSADIPRPLPLLLASPSSDFPTPAPPPPLVLNAAPVPAAPKQSHASTHSPPQQRHSHRRRPSPGVARARYDRRDGRKRDVRHSQDGFARARFTPPSPSSTSSSGDPRSFFFEIQMHSPIPMC